ncbi:MULTISPECIES: 7TM diverse intracellular signaling domain-containing protein [unclassified Nitratiruptor]|uniref:7TM diverse intracellular signaling domain-containing protein n=1 Tax=unclassified Nitratiruptor TaxID=2624044 RepID=UPI001915E883|nr:MULTISPECIES: 7TM diverse intracellular signaling domain-containing protein [unclassified Nitratiruptor]BCD59817.1 hypothetical protein NitYY0810_C0574 [Nitratiruptor sp. YY08-10]BCD63741.1 hypothetical protein NitYY0814_C0574 [Nitratiruptor sp. YY08-14]
MKRVCLLFLFFHTLFAQTILLDENHIKNITPFTKYYLDKNSSLHPDYLLHHKQLWKPTKSKALLLGYQYDATLWLLFRLKNPFDKTITKVLEYDYPIQEKIWLYDINNSKMYKSGYRLKPLPAFHITHPFFLHFKPHEEKLFLLKAQNNNVGFIAKLNILDPSYYEIKNENDKLITILFLGAMSALIAYNIFLLFMTEDASYLYYVLMVSSFLLLELFESGFFPLFFENFTMSTTAIYTLLLIMALSIIMFTVEFLQTKKNFPKIHAFLQSLIVSTLILYLLNITEIVSTTPQRIIYMVMFLIMIVIGLYAYFKGYKHTIYYIIGWILLFVVAVLLGLRQAGFISWIDNFPHLGKLFIFLEAILFSMALSARINAYKAEKERATKLLLEKKEIEKAKLEAYAEQKTQELTKALEEKNVLLKELHHRVKNNLQIIISLLRLQSDKLSDQKMQSILTEAESRIRALSSVHEMLYKSDNIAYINAQDYIQMLANELQHLFSTKNIDIHVHSNVNFTMDKAIYTGLIINELLTNAFKHAFPDNKGAIFITLGQKEDLYILTIRDTGKGLNNSNISKESLGLKLVDILVHHQLKGKIDIDTSLGTKYTITF